VDEQRRAEIHKLTVAGAMYDKLKEQVAQLTKLVTNAQDNKNLRLATVESYGPSYDSTFGEQFHSQLLSVIEVEIDRLKAEMAAL
jgi:hypothetical protein